jgi:predicted ATP-grasp superfamily ATP-dependent carboligase
MNQQGNSIIDAVNKLKSQGGDPDQMIQQMLNSGRINQSQYNAAVQKAQQIMQMLKR